MEQTMCPLCGGGALRPYLGDPDGTSLTRVSGWRTQADMRSQQWEVDCQPAPMIPILIWSLLCRPYASGGLLVKSERRGEVPVRLDLSLQVGDLLLRRRDCIGASDEA